MGLFTDSLTQADQLPCAATESDSSYQRFSVDCILSRLIQGHVFPCAQTAPILRHVNMTGWFTPALGSVEHGATTLTGESFAEAAISGTLFKKGKMLQFPFPLRLVFLFHHMSDLIPSSGIMKIHEESL